MDQFNPSDNGVDEVRSYLESADEDEKARVLAAERAGKARKTLLRENGIDPDERVDAGGRVLYPWEVSPKEQVVSVTPDETNEERELREAQLQRDEEIAGVQPAVDPAGTGVADVGAADVY